MSRVRIATAASAKTLPLEGNAERHHPHEEKKSENRDEGSRKHTSLIATQRAGRLSRARIPSPPLTFPSPPDGRSAS